MIEFAKEDDPAATASWWHPGDFRMYALVQRAARPGERVFVLAGSGHIAILRDRMPSLVIVPCTKLLPSKRAFRGLVSPVNP
ncbi:MAG: DUF5694 domain-containing protein [Gammaproteobacteria bacterium]|nr:DUF5694 domain-containing protein [Gammaproteobacteria bacterium]